MNKEFITYEQALALKELGFYEPCFGKFYYNHLEIGGIWNNNNFKEDPDIFISAPTFSQAFRWFREKYDLTYVIVKAESWFYTINGCNTQEGFKIYEEAEIACLKKLIEIVRGQN